MPREYWKLKYPDNGKLVELFTSTGTILIPEEENEIYIFHDKFSGFVKTENNISFLHNMLFDIFTQCKKLKMYNLFYTFPLQFEEEPLPVFLKKFVESVDMQDIDGALEDHDYNEYIWEIGSIAING
jgi:hypothetical protein